MSGRPGTEISQKKVRTGFPIRTSYYKRLSPNIQTQNTILTLNNQMPSAG